MTMIQAFKYLVDIAEVSDRKLNKMYDDLLNAFVRWTTLGYLVNVPRAGGVYSSSIDRANDYKEFIKEKLGSQSRRFRFRVKNTMRGYCVQVRTLTDAEKYREAEQIFAKRAGFKYDAMKVTVGEAEAFALIRAQI